MSGIAENEIKEIEQFLDTIHQDFHNKDINVLHRVVKILTSPDQSEIIENLEQKLNQVEHVLSKIVDESYQGLLVSIQSYSHIVERVQNNKTQVKSLKNNISESVQLLAQNASHTEAKWKLASQYGDMCQLLDCISWLKCVPSIIKQFIPNLNELLQNIQIQDENIQKKQLNYKLYLHSSLILISASNLLQSHYPKVEEGRNPIETCSTLIEKRKKTNNIPPLLQIPAIKPLCTQILQIYDKFHEIITEELRSLIYSDYSSFNEKLLPYYIVYEENISKLWPPLDSLILRDINNENKSYTEYIIEEKDKDYSEKPGYYMLLLVESLKTIGKIDIGSGYIASKAISEFRDIMSESFSFVRKIFEDDIKYHQGNLKQSSNTVNFMIDNNCDDYILYPNCIPTPHLISSYSPHEHSRSLVVLLNTIANRFLIILKKQIYLSQLVEHAKLKEDSLQIISKPNKVIKIYTFTDSHINSNSKIFNTSEMWELMQSEFIGLLRAQLQVSSLSDNFVESSNTLFRFVDSAAFTEKTQLATEEDIIFHSSPFNIIPIYLPLVRFNAMVISLLSKEGNTSWTLKEYLDQFNTTKLIDYIQDDVLTRVAEIYSSNDAWYIPSKGICNNVTQPLLNCGYKVYKIIEELFRDIQAIPIISNNLLELISTILSKLLGSFTEKFNSIFMDTHTLKHIKSKNVLELFASHPSWSQENRVEVLTNLNQSSQGIRMSSLLSVFPSEDIESNILFHEKELEIEKKLYSLKFDTKDNIIWDSHKLGIIASISNSVDYIYSNLKEISNKTDKIMKEYTTEDVFKNLEINSSKQMRKWLEKCQDIRKKCLYGIRTEIRIHCFYYIKQSTKCSYILEEVVEKGDSNIEELCADINDIEKRLKSLLQKQQLEFIFTDLPALVKSLLINILTLIGSVNQHGVSLLHKNILSLVQSLPETIITGNEHYFEDVQAFYDLLLLSPKKLLSHLDHTNSPKFSKTEYLIAASSLCTWQKQLKKNGNIDSIAIQQLKSSITDHFS